MIRLLCFIFALLSHKAQSLEVVNSPIDIQLYSFCNINKECKVSISLVNRTPYDVKLNSYYFGRNKVLLANILAFEAEKYHELEISGKNVYKSQVVVKIKNNKSLNSISFKPQEIKQYDLLDVENYFNFDVDKDYFVKFYIPHVSIYINDDFVGTTSIKSNFGYIVFPTLNSEIQKKITVKK